MLCFLGNNKACGHGGRRTFFFIQRRTAAASPESPASDLDAEEEVVAGEYGSKSAQVMKNALKRMTTNVTELDHFILVLNVVPSLMP